MGYVRSQHKSYTSHTSQNILTDYVRLCITTAILLGRIYILLGRIYILLGHCPLGRAGLSGHVRDCRACPIDATHRVLSDAAGTNPPSPRHERRRAKPRPSTDTGVARGVRCGRRAHLVLIQTTLSQHRSRCLHRPMLSLASAECPRARRARAATRLAARPLRGCA